MPICKLRTSSVPRLARLGLLCSTLLMASCARQVETAVDLTDFDSLQHLTASSSQRHGRMPNMTNVRALSLQESAMSLGAQAALANRALTTNTELKLHGKTLDHIFNFNALMLESSVLPPVLLQGDQTLNLASPNAIRISDRTYRIHRQARFVTTVPNWRDYIWMNYHAPEKPFDAMLPSTREERAVWNRFLAIGWRKGMQQAQDIFGNNLARLTQDYKGMILYRKLLAMRMVSPPFVAKAHLGITGNSTEIHINDQVLRITALPGLQPNSSTWRPAVSKALQANQTVVDWKYISHNHAHPHDVAPDLRDHSQHPRDHQPHRGGNNDAIN